MPAVSPSKDGRYTYGDYLGWQDEKRWELIDGVPYLMTPSPGRRHQEVLFKLGMVIAGYLKGKPCQLYMAPLDVRLPEPGQSDREAVNVVQPDLLVVCDPGKLDERGCLGAPDLVVEIVSPSSARRDLGLKFDLYERYGVVEYWIVFPLDRTVHVYRRDEQDRYALSGEYTPPDVLTTPLLSGLEINLAEVFA
ncbi:Uma2 family endonuclease [Desulfurispora thermophila]|uniref:Uma2 family endonuclease n=1 Tax=Desulfurispora thermophila TaxID=265470 RepID=UPI0003768961|nr:Uma2 family endonuclease [Desulfurispora thermophila]